ncbi:MAG: hypothetical protein PWQ55_358 [Chloroflexota bacterium]|nr:hypothetical protein [Chloroflexota bacterium]
MATKLLDNAKKNKEDEFYTQLPDIEAEMRHYKNQFRDKIVFCNCDDPYESNFFKYFAMNFNFLGLKKLIATSYTDSPVTGEQLSLFEVKDLNVCNGDAKHSYKIEISEVTDENKDGAIDLVDIKHLLKNKKNALTFLEGSGDFRSKECIDLLKEVDIVVTNPPFSLFREYVAQLIKYKKKLVIIGSINAITYKEVFPLLRDNKLWLGYNNGDMEFRVPDYYEPRATRYREENGIKYRSMGNIYWYTNLDIQKRHESLTLYKHYTPEEYPHYENYEAINVNRVAEIPYDYDGAMGVPITFLDKYNPEQFEVIALGIVGSIEFSCEKKMEILKKGKPTGKYTINAKGTLYRKYNPKIDSKPPAFKDIETGELYSSIFARIIIRKKGVTL